MQRVKIDHKVNDIEALRTSGLQIISNSPSTLAASINETLDYSNGITRNNPLDDELLSRYQSFCQEFNYALNENTTRPTISFLREYSHLLD